MSIKCNSIRCFMQLHCSKHSLKKQHALRDVIFLSLQRVSNQSLNNSNCFTTGSIPLSLHTIPILPTRLHVRSFCLLSLGNPFHFIRNSLERLTGERTTRILCTFTYPLCSLIIMPTYFPNNWCSKQSLYTYLILFSWQCLAVIYESIGISLLQQTQVKQWYYNKRHS